MKYMDLLQGNTRTNAPVIKRATIVDRRSAHRVAEVIMAQDYVPNREVMECMRQRHSFAG